MATLSLRVLVADERRAAERLLYHRRRYHHEARTGKGPRYRKEYKYASRWRKRVERRMRLLRVLAKARGWNARKGGARYQVLKKVLALTSGQLPKPPRPKPRNGLATYSGRTVAAWFVPWLERSRRAGWRGVVVSGYRTPAYSSSLCYRMCGRSRCPGMCAGASSNHSGSVYPRGAVDLTDYVRFRLIQPRIGSPLRNRLPRDRVHFSVSGV